jgi:hypothetical protein
VNERPVLKADAIKFVMTFRNQVSDAYFLAQLKAGACLIAIQSGIRVSVCECGTFLNCCLDSSQTSTVCTSPDRDLTYMYFKRDRFTICLFTGH